MEVMCYNKKCLHIWFYRGKDKRFICCPKCRFKRILDKCRSFFLSKNDIHSDRPNDIHSDIQPIKLKTEFEPMKDTDGFTYLVDKKVAKQFKEALDNEEIEETPLPGTGVEQESDIKILPSKFKIIRTIPYDPIKHLEHQQEYGLRIAN